MITPSDKAPGAFASSAADAQRAHDDRETRAEPRAREAYRHRLHAMLSVLSEGIVMLSPDGTVDAVNPAGARILGTTAGAMLGRKLASLNWRAYHANGDELSRDKHPILVALRTRASQPEMLLRYPRPDGVHVWIATTAHPLFDSDGTVLGSMASFRDVTEERRAEQQLRDSELRYRSLFESTALAKLLVDVETSCIVTANPAALRFYGMTEAELVGLHVARLSRLDPSSAAEMSKEVVQGKASIIRRRHYIASGEAREVEIHASPLERDGRLVLHAIVVDVTQRIEAEVERERLAAVMRDQAEELETQKEELARQTEELLMARDAAEQANAAKSRFLAHMSHELRTPLTAIIGFSRVLQANREGRLSAKDVQFAERVSSNAVRLLTLINQVLDLSKVEAGHVEVDWSDVDVSALARDVVADLDKPDRSAEVALSVVTPERALLRSDEGKLRQVVLNLASNALKFTERGTVKVIVHADDAGVARSLEVVDTGIGIDPANAASVFAPFTQEDDSITRRFGGTGLGLAISKQFSDMMGYRLELESAPGQGSTFRLLFDTPHAP